MRWRAKLTTLLPRLAWICLVLAVATWGAVVVRNVTDALMGIAYHQPSYVVVERPNR
jgi:hypothetical protein